MKKQFVTISLTAFIFFTISWFAACRKGDSSAVSVTPKAKQTAANQNSLVFPSNANMFGKSYGQWAAEWWKWALSYGCSTNPMNDATGALQNQGQTNPDVYFLAGTTGGAAVRSVTIPAGKSIFVPIINVLFDYPCPAEFNFEPGAGETLEHLLTSNATSFMNMADQYSVELDGVSLTNLGNYRAASAMFNFTGDASLANVCMFDPCITGTVQQGATDGYWLMIKPLSVGTHTLHVQAGASAANFTTEFTYNIIVQ